MKKGKWSKEEDDLIKNHMEKYGIGRSWQALSDALGLQRCGRSCRSRWLNYLRPGLKHGDFSPAEERIICKMYSKKGSSWSAIAAQLPGRTDLAVKNYWNSTLKKRFPAAAAARSTAAARRRHRPAASATTSSDDDDDVDVDDATPPGLALVVYSDGSTAAAAAAGELAPYSISSPAATADAAEEEEPIAAVPISTCILALPPPPPPPPPPPSDATGGEVSIPCFPFSPLPFIEPDLPELTWTTDLDDITATFDAAACRYPKRPHPITPDSPRLPKLPAIAGFDDVQSFFICLRYNTSPFLLARATAAPPAAAADRCLAGRRCLYSTTPPPPLSPLHWRCSRRDPELGADVSALLLRGRLGARQLFDELPHRVRWRRGYLRAAFAASVSNLNARDGHRGVKAEAMKSSAQ
uniref:Uncharacterized protein n=1 Tax=Oryza nivara TaxID=4536 RepID=A0A0E0IUR8_ORYNI